jgi:hypothetical protein
MTQIKTIYKLISGTTCVVHAPQRIYHIVQDEINKPYLHWLARQRPYFVFNGNQ